MQREDLEPVVLIPGLLCTAALFGKQLQHFRRKRRDVTIADHMRHATMDHIAADILRVAPARFALAGLSMGGYVAFAILRAEPERVTRLALIDTNARADRPEQSAKRRDLIELGRAHGVRKAQEALLPFLLHQNRLSDAALVETVLQMADDTGLAAFERQQEAIIGRPDNRLLLDSITCPTLIVVGADDQLTPVKVAEEMHAGIRGSRIAIIPDCGHLSTLEQPARVNRLLGQWLAM